VSLNINAAESPALPNQKIFIAGPGRTSGDSLFGFFDIAAIQTDTRRSDFRFAERLAVQSCFDALDYLTYIALGQH